ncbi:hypothetical protein D1007_18682 [Hordeum vulgare]|nr:hypothetical protein D1007_18682 [Hordeum vulgare]
MYSSRIIVIIKQVDVEAVRTIVYQYLQLSKPNCLTTTYARQRKAINTEHDTIESTAAPATAPAAAATASSAAGAERRADDDAGGQAGAGAEGKPRAGSHAASLLPPGVHGRRRVRVARGRRVPVRPGGGRRRVPLAVVVDVVVVLPARLLGPLGAAEGRHGRHRHRRDDGEGQERRGASKPQVAGERSGVLRGQRPQPHHCFGVRWRKERAEGGGKLWEEGSEAGR